MTRIIDIISQYAQNTIVSEYEHFANQMMKRMLLFIIMFISLNSFGQQHISVFGLPLNGSINNFTTKLATKGIVVDKEQNRAMPVGVRAFKGSFAGYFSSRILVFYDSRTKNIFKCVINFDGLDEQEYFRMFEDIKERILSKHKDIIYMHDGKNQDGYPMVDFSVSESKNRSNVIGDIKMGILEMKVFPFEKAMYVSYTDRYNLNKFKGSSQDDL